MIKPNKLLFLSSALAFLFLSFLALASAQSSKNYVLAFSYEKTMMGDTLSLISSNVSDASLPSGLEPNGSYSLEIILESGKILGPMPFNIPPLAQGSQEITFSILAPYQENGKAIIVHDKQGAKLLEIIAPKSILKQQSEELIGELRIIHGDDFEHPENTQYYYYLHTGSKVYQLQSTQFPPIPSGTIVKVQGALSGNIITLEGPSAIEPVNGTVNPFPVFNQPQAASEGTHWGFGSKWIYLSLLAILALILLFIKFRKKASPLRDYAAANLKKGYTKEQVRNALLKNGYNNQEIEEAFRALK